MSPHEQLPAPTALVQKKPYPSIRSLVAMVVIVGLVWAFITGRTTRFYASFLFLFYSVVDSMWISVVFLGVFQTLLMVPLRIVNLLRATTTADYKETVIKQKQAQEQQFLIRKHARKGNPILLWYTVSFVIQLVSYVSIGRLFLIDFYSIPLDTQLLYDWVPYPEYPISGLFFKIPYLGITATRAFSWRAVLLASGVIVLLQAVFYLIRMFRQSRKMNDVTPQSKLVSRALTLASGSTVVVMVVVAYLLRHFPTGVELRIFSGDISIPNRTFNTVTAIATFITIFWLDLSTIRKKTELAVAQGIAIPVIRETQKVQIKDSLRTAIFVGAGAFFITNHIPSAFELSIFTFEVISWLSPLTLDRIIKARVQNDQTEETGQDEGTEIKNKEVKEKVG